MFFVYTEMIIEMFHGFLTFFRNKLEQMNQHFTVFSPTDTEGELEKDRKRSGVVWSGKGKKIYYNFKTLK